MATPPQVTEAALKADVAKGPVVTGVTLPDGAYVVLRVLKNLPRAVGERRAREIIMTGKPFDAQQAADWGLANQVHAPDKLLAAALETATVIAGNAPLSVRQVKKSVRYGGQMELRTALRFEVEAYNHLVDTEDRMEGVRAFNEKRKPVFKGR